MSVPDRLVSFAHGKESGPWGAKITQLAEVARRRGFAVESLDYSHTQDPDERVRQLLDHAPAADCLVLVGSSMGGYVAAQACAGLAPDALFLMAPALYFDGYATEPTGIPDHCAVVHGWRDTVVTPDRGIRFARTHRTRLHMLDSGHTLTDCLPCIETLFDAFLRELTESRA